MSNIPSAYPSPRIANGVLLWYEGDTFDLTFRLELTDQDGEPVEIQSSDSVTVKFYDSTFANVKTFSFTNIQSNTIVLDFDQTATALFPRGKYTYDVLYSYNDRTTIAAHNKAVVE